MTTQSAVNHGNTQSLTNGDQSLIAHEDGSITLTAKRQHAIASAIWELTQVALILVSNDPGDDVRGVLIKMAAGRINALADALTTGVTSTCETVENIENKIEGLE